MNDVQIVHQNRELKIFSEICFSKINVQQVNLALKASRSPAEVVGIKIVGDTYIHDT
jgi:hypothetical protein